LFRFSQRLADAVVITVHRNDEVVKQIMATGRGYSKFPMSSWNWEFESPSHRNKAVSNCRILFLFSLHAVQCNPGIRVKAVKTEMIENEYVTKYLDELEHSSAQGRCTSAVGAMLIYHPSTAVFNGRTDISLRHDTFLT
jgi:hypothetical protein